MHPPDIECAGTEVERALFEFGVRLDDRLHGFPMERGSENSR